ncbi:MAG: energy transducer TonB [Bacteroidetes bacterium]|nr:energy transducer TonB [Bacteroidota bacterium]MCL2303240.1 energy transducer TonB [Lentimicrobiaceae bacterium]
MKTVLLSPFFLFLFMLHCNIKAQENQISKDTLTLSNPVEAVEDETSKKEKELKPPMRYTHEAPEPIEGFKAMSKFIQDNTVYPDMPKGTKGSGIPAQVFVEFIIEEDGSFSNVKILVGVNPYLDAEAIRVIKLLPKWKPGKHMGKPVRTFYQLPVKFTPN